MNERMRRLSLLTSPNSCSDQPVIEEFHALCAHALLASCQDDLADSCECWDSRILVFFGGESSTIENSPALSRNKRDFLLTLLWVVVRKHKTMK